MLTVKRGDLSDPSQLDSNSFQIRNAFLSTPVIFVILFVLRAVSATPFPSRRDPIPSPPRSLPRPTMDLFFIFSGIYLLSLLTLTLLLFLYILGATPRPTRHPPAPQAPPPEPATFHAADDVIPRRLSFSAALSTPTPLFSRRNLRPSTVHRTPTPPAATRARRVTFSLTPEQQRAEQLKARAVPVSYELPADPHATPPPLVELFPPRAPTPAPAPAPPPPRRRTPSPPPRRVSPPLPRARPQTRVPAAAVGSPFAPLLSSLQSQTVAAVGRRREKERRFVELSERSVAPLEAPAPAAERPIRQPPVMRRESLFGNGPMAVRGYEGEAIVFAGRRQRKRAAALA